jgi:DNA invertase Pin-like site-specific DNA recombinase
MNGRLELARMTEAADRRAFDILLVEDITRLSHKAIDASKIGQVLADHDITIFTVRSGVAGSFGRDGTRRNPKEAA